MAKLVWDQPGEKLYETGVENTVLYLLNEDGDAYTSGYAWNGVTTVDENPSGAESNTIWADNTKYLNLISTEEFSATLNAYTYPDEFMECDGSKEIAPGVYAGQQNRKTFGLAYKTLLGNDAKNTEYGYKLHLIYGCLASPSSKSYSTVNDNPEAIEFSWEINTTPVPTPTGKPTASIVIDSTKTASGKLAALEKILFGDTDVEPRLPLPAELATLMREA